jgi:CHAT domain-containing protein
MHFAVHGIYDPTGTEDGLVLTDGHVLDPLQVKGSTFSRAPFVFLNACQVGSGNKILGDYAGLANAFLYSGAAGVVAPLWSVQDTIAKDLALNFYAKAFGGAGVGEVLRSQRAQFIKSDDPISATYLAYQYFGHPEMRIKRVLPLEEGESWQSSTQTETPSASATS